MSAGELMQEPRPGLAAAKALPKPLRRCRRVVAVTLHLPEFLVAAAGLVQRLGEAGRQIDVLVAASSDEPSEEAAHAGLRELRVPELARHRLALPIPFGAEREPDLVAAMSELVGFDPEPGVYCLAPDIDSCADPSRLAVSAAARRIAEVYGLSLVRYSAAPDSMRTAVELDVDEWSRKCAGLAACATQVTPLSGRLEYYAL
jgi:hypothetical protein